MVKKLLRRPRRGLVRMSVVLAVVVGVLVSMISPASAAPLGTTPRQLQNYGYTSSAPYNCLHEDYPSPTSKVELFDCSAGYVNSNEWKGNGDYTIRNVLTGLCLTTTANAPGTTTTAVTAAVCNGSAYQEWSYSYVGSPSDQIVTLHNLGSDWYLDSDGDTVYTHAGNTGNIFQEWLQVF